MTDDLRVQLEQAHTKTAFTATQLSELQEAVGGLVYTTRVGDTLFQYTPQLHVAVAKVDRCRCLQFLGVLLGGARVQCRLHSCHLRGGGAVYAC